MRVPIDQLDTELARQGGPWLPGEHYNALDAYALMLCRWTRNFAQPARMRTQLAPYLERVLVRLAVARVFDAEGLARPWVQLAVTRIDRVGKRRRILANSSPGPLPNCGFGANS